MKIAIDDKIPYIRGVLEPFAEVVYLEGGRATPEIVRDADALVTRTRTRCNRALLEGSKVRFIATATIGFDHIDTDYCRRAGIEWVNAPGCNAESVNQYLASALFSWARLERCTLQGQTIGIVGVGQTGSRVARTCEILGMKVLLNDPPRERREGPGEFVSLQAIRRQSDIISFHVPLNREGIDRTLHMVDDVFCSDLPRRPLLINTCRGEVFDTEAVKAAFGSGTLAGLIIDCWEHEPKPDRELLGMAAYGTPHIAGYSRDGKANGTKTAVRAVSRNFGLGIDEWEPAGVEGPENPVIELEGRGRADEEILADAILATYEIERDDTALRANTNRFEQLRGNYPVRREFDSYSIRAVGVPEEILRKLGALAFSLAYTSGCDSKEQKSR
jgi:erythronate-4-phosphate dehydrogenase